MNNFFLYGETAFLHEGDIDYLKLLIAKVAKSKAKGIKFQVLTNASDFVSTEHTAYKDLASYCFGLNQWREIFSYTLSLDLEIIMMPLNLDSLILCDEFEIKFLEIHSVSNNDFRLKEAVQNTNIDLILTAGGRFEDEIESDIRFFNNQVAVLMVGFQAFPSLIEDVRLGQVKYWRNKYPNLTIGYADHSSFDSKYSTGSLEYAFLLGARVFEKHITLDEGKERVDYASAIGVEKLDVIHENLIKIGGICDNINYNHDKMTNPEFNYRKRQLICVASNDIPENTILSANNISLKMYHDSDNTFDKIGDLIGKKISNAIKKDFPFTLNNTIENDS